MKEAQWSSPLRGGEPDMVGWIYSKIRPSPLRGGEPAQTTTGQHGIATSPLRGGEPMIGSQ